MRQYADVFHALQKEWKQDPPLPLDEYLAEIDKTIASATTPTDEAIRLVAEENAKVAPQLGPDGQNLIAGMNAVNAIRVMCGLNALVYDPKLCEAATGHSADMQRLNFFAHVSPVPGKSTFTDRAKLAGTTASGENIYKGSSSPKDAIKAWFLSPGHHRTSSAPGTSVRASAASASTGRKSSGRGRRSWGLEGRASRRGPSFDACGFAISKVSSPAADGSFRIAGHERPP